MRMSRSEAYDKDARGKAGSTVQVGNFSGTDVLSGKAADGRSKRGISLVLSSRHRQARSGSGPSCATEARVAGAVERPVGGLVKMGFRRRDADDVSRGVAGCEGARERAD